MRPRSLHFTPMPAGGAGLRDVADEIVQETWLIAVRRLSKFDPEHASFVTWLHGIAANLARNHFRKEKRRPIQALGDIDVPSPSANNRDEAERIARALGGLPEHYEMVLRAKYLDQQSVVQIAAREASR